MSDQGSNFSDRFGYRAPDAEITIREDAPEDIRGGIVMLGYDAGIAPSGMRDVVCKVLRKRPDSNNWSPGNVNDEVNQLIDGAPWPKIYDIAEKLYVTIGEADHTGQKQSEYEKKLNELFREHGIGWQMENGMIAARGSEAFSHSARNSEETMRRTGNLTAANEMHESLIDISRRPVADVTGAIQHAMAALECVAREVDGSTDTLGKIINRLSLPAPLDQALHKLWGFASDQGRHIQEGREPKFEEAELVVTVASAVSVYLLRRRAV